MTQEASLKDVALSLARALGADWSLAESGELQDRARCYRAILHHVHGDRALYLQVHDDKGRMQVFGVVVRPADSPRLEGSTSTPTITLSMSRPAATLARDITRRVLGNLQLAVEQCRQETEERQRGAARVAARVEQIRAILPATQAGGDTTHGTTLYAQGPDGTHLTFCLSPYSDSVEISSNYLPFGAVIALCEWLRDGES